MTGIEDLNNTEQYKKELTEQSIQLIHNQIFDIIIRYTHDFILKSNIQINVHQTHNNSSYIDIINVNQENILQLLEEYKIYQEKHNPVPWFNSYIFNSIQNEIKQNTQFSINLDNPQKRMPIFTYDSYMTIYTKGLNILLSVYKEILFVTKSSQLAYYHTQKTYFNYLEYIQQACSESMFKISLQDISMFLYRKTIFQLNQSWRKNIQYSEQEQENYKQIYQWCSDIKYIFIHIHSCIFSLYTKYHIETQPQSQQYTQSLNHIYLYTLLLHKSIIILNPNTNKHNHLLSAYTPQTIIQQYKTHLTELEKNVNDIHTHIDTGTNIDAHKKYLHDINLTADRNHIYLMYPHFT